MADKVTTIIQKLFDESDYASCMECGLYRICDSEQLLCKGAIVGILCGKKWEPKNKQ